MTRDRLSIAGLLALVALAATGLAALRSASDLWAAAMFTATLGALGAATIVAMQGRGPRRTRAAGFALAGWGYLLLSMGPWCQSAVAPHLLTTRLLDELRLRSRAVPRVGHKVRAVMSGELRPAAVVEVKDGRFKLHYDGWSTYHDEWVALDRLYDPASEALAAPAAPTVAGRPGVNGYENFMRTGHSLLALTLALAGAAVARAVGCPAPPSADEPRDAPDGPPSRTP
jgi:hypothetical protein